MICSVIQLRKMNILKLNPIAKINWTAKVTVQMIIIITQKSKKSSKNFQIRMLFFYKEEYNKLEPIYKNKIINSPKEIY